MSGKICRSCDSGESTALGTTLVGENRIGEVLPEQRNLFETGGGVWSSSKIDLFPQTIADMVSGTDRRNLDTARSHYTPMQLPRTPQSQNPGRDRDRTRPSILSNTKPLDPSLQKQGIRKRPAREMPSILPYGCDGNRFSVENCKGGNRQIYLFD